MVEKNSKKTLVLLDTHAIIHRAYHALPDFTSPSGDPTGALYGLSSMLMRIVRELKPNYIIACYDLPKPTFRHEVYKEYKGTRQKTDDELIEQIIRSREIFKAFNIPTSEKAGFEADDIIGTLAEQAKKNKDIHVIIASGDMDTLQLTDKKKVQIFTLRKGLSDTVMYDEGRVKERFGFDPKLLTDYKGLRGDPSDNIVGIKGIGEKTATSLIQEFGTIENMYSVLKKDRSVFEKKGFKERIIKLLEEGKEEALFSKVLATIRLDAPVTFNVPKKDWKEEISLSQVKELFSELGFKSLTTRLSEIFPEQKLFMEQEEKIEEHIDPIELEKTSLALWILDSNITNPDIGDIKKYTRKKDFKSAREIIFKDLKKDKLEYIYNNIELPLIPILKKTEEKGVLIDSIYLKELSKKYHKELSSLEKKTHNLAGESFNINSPKQLREILFEKLDISKGRIKKTATGAKSTRAAELEKLKDTHEIIPHILSYREFQKLLSTYIDNIPDMLDEDKRLHTNFIQTGTATGRMASQNPNLQNIPIRTELGRNIRKAFIAEKGYKLVSFDYSQIELRISAILSGDKVLKKIFKEGNDVHTATAAEVFHVPLSEVTKDMRRIAKIINFGVIYGMGVNAIRQNVGSTREEAQKFYANYFGTFKTLADYLEKTKEVARKKGYTETLYGRRRHFPGIKSPLPYIRAMEERMALNAPIQGTSADIIKLAMVKTEERLKKEGILEDTHIILQIHDELLYEIKEGKIQTAVKIIKEEMESVVKKDVEFVVGASAGYNWGEMEEVNI